MSKSFRALSLVDCLAALMVVLFGVGATTALTLKSYRYWHAHRERMTAREIMSHVRDWPTSFLDQMETRSFDVRGLAMEGNGKYILNIESTTEDAAVTYHCVLRYRDLENVPRELRLVRREWRRR